MSVYILLDINFSSEQNKVLSCRRADTNIEQ